MSLKPSSVLASGLVTPKLEIDWRITVPTLLSSIAKAT